MTPNSVRIKNVLTVSNGAVISGNVVISNGQLVVGGTAINSTSISGSADNAYTNAIAIAANGSNITSGTVAAARLPSLFIGTTTIQSTSAAQAVSGITTLATGNTTITGDVTVSGNLTVSGTRTYVNTTTLDVGDNIVTLNADLGANPPTENAGLEIMRGTSANVQFLWDETNDRWTTNGQEIAISSLVANGAASGITTLAAGNTTITGFANVSTGVNSALLSVGNNFIANTTQVTIAAGVNLSANGGVGTAGQVLASNGASGSPYWTTAVGPQGAQGATGAQGAQGPQGAQGAQGSVATPTDDTTSNATYYPIVAIATSNNTLTTSSTKLYYNPSTGTLNATNFNSLSDETVKENIQKIQDATNLLDTINPVSFTWKDSGSLSYGVIAQEIEKVLPTIVATNEDNGLKSVSYDQLIPILVQAIKELKIEIDHLKNNK